MGLAVSKGLTTQIAADEMVDSVKAGKFAASYVEKVWTLKLNEHEGSNEHGAGAIVPDDILDGVEASVALLESMDTEQDAGATYDLIVAQAANHDPKRLPKPTPTQPNPDPNQGKESPHSTSDAALDELVEHLDTTIATHAHLDVTPGGDASAPMGRPSPKERLDPKTPKCGPCVY